MEAGEFVVVPGAQLNIGSRASNFEIRTERRVESSDIVDSADFCTTEERILFSHSLGAVPNGFYARYGKRFFDIALALIALVAFSPVMLLTAITVIVGDGFPVIYRQPRAGLGLRQFIIVKFRTMLSNTESYEGSWKRSDPQRWDAGAPECAKRDPRVFRGAHTLRKYSMDELPQLWNVLRGEMSLVGPRPLLCRQVEDNIAGLGDVLKMRAMVRPGITGLWQISGRSNITFDCMIALDLEYARKLNFLDDLKILLKTIHVVLRASGAA